MEEELITFEIAKLAKEKGFNKTTNTSYNKKGVISNRAWIRPYIGDINSSHRLTQSLLQKWLREKHHIIVEPRFIGGLTKATAWYDFVIYSNLITEEDDARLKMRYKTYEQALEIALQEGLKLIK